MKTIKYVGLFIWYGFCIMLGLAIAFALDAFGVWPGGIF